MGDPTLPPASANFSREKLYEAMVEDAAPVVYADGQWYDDPDLVAERAANDGPARCGGFGTCRSLLCAGVKDCVLSGSIYDRHPSDTSEPWVLTTHTDPSSPVTNPKEGAGAQKPPTWSVMPRWVMLLVGRVMQIGAAKYDAFNYREAPITASTYEDAMERHAALWFDGEDDDPETGVSHLASIIASCSLLLDSQAGEMLVDNRQKTGKVRKALDALDALKATHPLPPKNPNAPSLQKGR